jgi:hypothetical protein
MLVGAMAGNFGHGNRTRREDAIFISEVGGEIVIERIRSGVPGRPFVVPRSPVKRPRKRKAAKHG